MVALPALFPDRPLAKLKHMLSTRSRLHTSSSAADVRGALPAGAVLRAGRHLPVQAREELGAGGLHAALHGQVVLAVQTNTGPQWLCQCPVAGLQAVIGDCR